MLLCVILCSSYFARFDDIFETTIYFNTLILQGLVRVFNLIFSLLKVDQKRVAEHVRLILSSLVEKGEVKDRTDEKFQMYVFILGLRLFGVFSLTFT